MAWAGQESPRRCAIRPRKWEAKNGKYGYKCGQSMNLDALRSKIRCETNSRRNEY
jgi:hypothetical protein